ncbi:MAG: cytochrome c [Chloroflexi bacterium]|nr:cytochrome c [Chloroflexota bacterium]
MRRSIALALTLMFVVSLLLVVVVAAQGGSAQRGGQLYDNWFKVVGASPTGNMPLWATQSTNTRSGEDTWRCKECHGWDYKGVDGVYGSGSHKTGFPGVYAARTKSVDDIVAALKGGTNADHDFSADMSDADLTDLATFITTAVVDTDLIIDPATKAVKGNATDGKALYDSTCAACHGADGLAIDFHAGTDEGPEFVGTVANENPWELFNKIRSGQPGEAMPAQLDPSSMTGSWTLDEVSDVLAYAQTLPEERAAATSAPTELPTTGGSELPVLPLGLAIAGLALLGLGLYRRTLLQNS